MGNSCCIFIKRDFFTHRVRQLFYVRKQEFASLVEKEYQNEHTESGNKNAISEYMSWALNHSLSPLLLDDAVSHSSLSPHFDEFNSAITTSWMSDGAPSDSSHILYREVDPYKSLSFGVRQGTSNSSIDTTCDYSKRSAEVSEYPYSSKNVESRHPLIEEDVDSRELARLTRHLWPSNRYQKFSSSKKSSKERSSIGLGSTASSVNQEQTNIPRPTNLKIRPNSESLVSVGPGVQNEGSKQESYLGSSGDDTTLELAWDHEPGTQPVVKTVPQSTPISRTTDYSSDHNVSSRLRHSRIPPIPNDSYRPRRRPTTQGTLGSVAVLPVQDDTENDQNPADRWSSSNRFPPIAKEFGHRKALVTYLSLMPSPSESANDDKIKKLSSNELEDSGFVGLANSFSDFDEDFGLNQPGELLWEHDPFYHQSSPMKPVS